MAWSGSWDSTNTIFTGTFTAEDGSTFVGTWTTATAQSGGATAPNVTPPAPPKSDDKPDEDKRSASPDTHKFDATEQLRQAVRTYWAVWYESTKHAPPTPPIDVDAWLAARRHCSPDWTTQTRRQDLQYIPHF